MIAPGVKLLQSKYLACSRCCLVKRMLRAVRVGLNKASANWAWLAAAACLLPTSKPL